MRVRGRSPASVFRWDLDKTYLVSHFESLRHLIRIPFQRAEDKRAVPGVIALIRGLRRTSESKGCRPQVYFLSASPPQIGGAIRQKLELDGIAYEGITFKDQVRHLIRARFDAVLEQIGYKLEQLLLAASESESQASELLFGDDWESDPFVYSLYADILAGRIGRDLTIELLASAGVSRHYVDRIAALVEAERRDLVVDRVFVLRQLPSLPSDLEAFGPRLTWFDNYFECALKLYAIGALDLEGVVDVACETRLTPVQLAASFVASDERGSVDGARLGPVRAALVTAGIMGPVPAGRRWRRLTTASRRSVGLPPEPRSRSEFVPDYRALVGRWSYRGRKEAVHDEDGSRGRADDRRQRA